MLKKKSRIKNVKHEYADESLDSFLNSAMNNEYVYLILRGINAVTTDDNDILKN